MGAGAASFFSSGFVASLLVVTPNSPGPVVPPVPARGKLPIVGGTGVDIPGVSGFFVPKKPLPKAGVVVEVEVEAVTPSAGLGGSPKNPPVPGVVVDVNELLGGLGGPPNSPSDVLFVPSDPLNRPPEIATKCN